MCNLNNRKFRGAQNSANGQVSGETLFHYHQEGSLLWGEYGGGEIRLGRIVGSVIGPDKIHFSYSHVDKEGELKTGLCTSMVSKDKNGLYILSENWQWTSGDCSSGESLVKEYR